MLRRFNSLIKGQKVQYESTEHVGLRPTRSVDSAAMLQPHTALDPLQIARTRDNLISRFGSGQPSRSGTSTRPEEGEEQSRSSLISRVPEESSWKEGYEYGRLNLDSPSTPQKPFLAEEKLDSHTIDLSGTANEYLEPSTRTSEEVSELNARTDGDSTLPQVPPHSASEGHPHELPRVLRTSSSAITSLGSQNLSGFTAIDIPDAQTGGAVDLENLRKGVVDVGPPRTISAFSSDSNAECCRICQQRTEEQLIDLGCSCRGDLSKAHNSCIETWFKNKGTNKCEVCQCVATNIPAPISDPMPHFWVWRLGGAHAIQQAQMQSGPRLGARRVGIYSGPVVTRPVLLMIIKKRPFIPVLWVLLLASMTYLFVNAINSSSMGYAAMPIGFIFGVLVVLGLGTAARLVLECYHERAVRENIRRMELTPIFEEAQVARQPDPEAPQPPTQETS